MNIFKQPLTAREIKHKARALGADLVGIADGETLNRNPRRCYRDAAGATAECGATCPNGRPSGVTARTATVDDVRRPMTARQTAISDIASHRVAKTQDYLADAGADIYGQYVFHEGAQSQYLAKPIFRKLRRTIDGHEPFDPAIVDAVAHGVKEWALAHGATHYPLVHPDDRLHG